jgi:hypothetical protein
MVLKENTWIVVGASEGKWHIMDIFGFDGRNL